MNRTDPLPRGQPDRALPPDARTDTTKVRQGITLGVMRWVLALSMAAAIIGLVIARLIA